MATSKPIISSKSGRSGMYYIFFIHHFFTTHIQAKSRNEQLGCYESNWATLEIMKTLLKNKRSYQKRIGRVDPNVDDIVMDDKEGDTLAGEVNEEEEDEEGSNDKD